MTRREFVGITAAVLSAGGTALGACGRSEDTPVPSSQAGRARASREAIYGLSFPGSAAVSKTMRFRFTRPLAIYPATYIWRAYPIRQAGYYTAFFWGNDDGKGDLSTFLWVEGRDADTYYGAHPYPNPPPNGTAHDWEISIMREDPVNGAVVYDRWYTQAFRAWSDWTGKRHEFYWNLPRIDSRHRVMVTAAQDYGNASPPAPTLTWGDAPWNPGREVWCGVLRGLQIYAANLSVPEILKEMRTPLSTSVGAASVWYLNLNPTPEDISDKSGRGNNPEWVGHERPRLWTGTGEEAGGAKGAAGRSDARQEAVPPGARARA